jgi:two-component system repressor protein LuxO
MGAARIMHSADTALGLCDRDRFDIVIVSLGHGGSAEAQLVRQFAVRQSHAAIIAVSAQGSLSNAVELMRAGAADVLVRPVSVTQLRAALERIAVEMAERGTAAPACASGDAGPGNMIGACAAMQELYRTLRQAAPSRASVFIHGESGTGKEHCAQAVHELSPRANGPMISINCSAIPHELMESEIFGHEKGAFTGAHEARSGAAERADGGTLFLDEICEMDLGLQAKLLRFIQTGSFTRVGGSRVRKVDVRFVCATNKNPTAAIQRGEFRADLYYRLHVLPVSLPPLRERGVDVLDIARDALARFAAEEGKGFCAFAPEVEALLLAYEWPGNVRELLNVVRNIVVMNDGAMVEPAMVPLPLARGIHVAGDGHAGLRLVATLGGRDAVQAEARRLLKPLWQHEQDIIERAIALCGGNIGAAAAHLEISPSTIYRKRHTWLQAGAA